MKLKEMSKKELRDLVKLYELCIEGYNLTLDDVDEEIAALESDLDFAHSVIEYLADETMRSVEGLLEDYDLYTAE